MLSYQHIYHAGNPVDCQKHALMSALLSDQGAIHYIDTHSGRGLYDLETREAQKIKEYRTGIDKIWPLGNWPKELRRYQHLLEELNPDGICRYYPGSPRVALAHALNQAGASSRLDLYEIHPQEYAALEQEMSGIPSVHLHKQSGWGVLANGFPPSPLQKIVLIDPSYEMKEEYITLPDLVQRALIHTPDAIILIWYPMLSANRHQILLKEITRLVTAPTLRNEIHLTDPATTPTKGLYATGLLCINPPQGFDVTVQKIGHWLALAIGTHSVTEWLVLPA